MDPRGTVDRIYRDNHYTLLHTKYESSAPCGFGEEDFYFFPIVSPWELMTPGVRPFLTPGVVGRIYRGPLHIDTYKI